MNLEPVSGFMTNEGFISRSEINGARYSDNYLILNTSAKGKVWVKFRSESEAKNVCLRLGYYPRSEEMNNQINSQQLQAMLGFQSARNAERGIGEYKNGDLPKNLNENKKEKSKMSEMLSDVKNYVREHRSVIYTVVLIVLADHFLLGGKLRHKLEALLNGALDKAQEKLNGTKTE